MATYLFGDIQGCFSALQRLLTQLRYDPSQDQLWFAGDLVSRGTQSLETLRFVRSLGNQAITVLGNHDISLIAAFYGIKSPHKSLNAVINAPDYAELIHWLRHQPLLYVNETTNSALVHAGIFPLWDLPTAQQYAQQLEQQLQQADPSDWLQHAYGNEPVKWHNALSPLEQQRFALNAFTRMRYCYPDTSLEFQEKLSPAHTQSTHPNLIPWFSHPMRKIIDTHIFFGHWSTLAYYQAKGITSLDTACVWGGKLSAICLETKQLHQVNCG